MKANIYILSLVLFVFSCKSVDKMVSKGNYNDAFYFAAKKLQNEKIKKDNYVKGIETAYEKLNAEDNSKIAFLMAKNEGSNWEKIYNIYSEMEKRQKTVSALSPLVSKSGYLAKFEARNYNDLKIEASEGHAKYYYSNAIDLLEKARKYGNKMDARAAYNSFSKIDKFYTDYLDKNNLKQETYQYGVYSIGVEIDSDRSGFFNQIIEQNLEYYNLSEVNTFWEKYQFTHNLSDNDFDKYVVISIQNIDFGFEKENVTNNNFTKEIQDGIEYKRDNCGNIVKDTLGNAIVQPKFINVNARVSEIFREKQSSLHATILLYNGQSTVSNQSVPLYINHKFEDKAVNIDGDKRALPQNMCNLFNSSIDRFPSNHEVALAMTNNLKGSLTSAIKRLNIEDR